MNKLRPYLIPLLLFFLSLVLRLALVSKGPYNVDCLHLAIVSEKTLDTFRLHSQFGTGYPLTVICGALFILFGRLFDIHDPVFSVNMMSVLFSSLCIPAIYCMTKKLLDETTAILSAITFSLCPIFLGVSVYGKSQPLNMFFLILGIFLLLSFFDSRQIKLLIWSSISLGLAGANRLHELVLMALPITFLFFYWENKNDSFKLWKNKPDKIKSFFKFWAIIIFIAIIFHLPYIIQNNRSLYGSQLSIFVQTGLLENFLGLFSPRLKNGIQYLIESFTLIGIILSMAGFYLLSKDKLKNSLFLLLWFLIPFFFYSNLHMTLTSRYFVIILPPVIIALCYALFRLMNVRFFLVKCFALVFFLLFVCTLTLKIYPILKFRHETSLLPDFAKWVGDNTEPHAKIICADERLFIDYYGKRASLARPMEMHDYTKEELGAFKQNLDNTLEEGIPVYITSASIYAYDPKRIFFNFVKKNYDSIYIGEHWFEDWHEGAMTLRIFPAKLFRVIKK